MPAAVGLFGSGRVSACWSRSAPWSRGGVGLSSEDTEASDRPVRGARPRTGHAVISGGSSGIGLALAHRLACAGWDLTLLAQNPGRLADARTALARHGVSVVTHSVDVADAAGVEAVLASTVSIQGAVTLVVACAGIVRPGRVELQPLEAFHRTIAVNYLGAVHLVRAALPHMRRDGRARIVLVASGAALIGFYGFTSYAPSKFAVRGFGDALRSELSAEGIAVSVVYPPDTDTPGYREELRHRPEISHRLAGAAGVMSADAVATAIMRGIARDRFVIAPGIAMTALAWLHSMAAPLVHRLWFDPLIARGLRKSRADAKRVPAPSRRSG